MKVSLLRALRIVIAADSDPVRQVLFSNLMQARWTVRVAYQLHARLAGTWASAVLVSGYALAYFLRITPPVRRHPSILGVAKHVNARRQVDRVFAWVGEEHCDRIGTRFHVRGALAGVAALASPQAFGGIRQSFRVIRMLDRRHQFLVACRAGAAIAWYARTLDIISTRRPRAVLVSSDSNPEEVGFTAAATALTLPRIFVSHAYPTPFAPPLDFSLSILEGEGAVRARMRKGPIRGKVVLGGVDGDSATLDAERIDRQNPVIGIFTPKAIAWPALKQVIEDCREMFQPRRIVIRWHPSRLDQARYLDRLRDRSDIEESAMSLTLPEVARRCDWVIADENSNVHLPVLKLGIPTVVVKGLGLYPETRADLYGFAAAGVVFPPVRSIKELRIPTFKQYFDAAWVDRFRQYDASYLRPKAEVACEVRTAIHRLLDAAREAEPV